jgi:hypothetical protein
MDRLSTNSSNTPFIPRKKSVKFVKNRFTDLKIKIAKKKENQGEVVHLKVKEEKKKKSNLDKDKGCIDKDLNNDNLLIKMINYKDVIDNINDLFNKSGEFKMTDQENLDESSDNIKNFSETSQEFFKKFRKFNENTRKGLLKQITPSNGFIKAAHEYMIVPNPIAFVNKSGYQGSVNLK